MKLTWILAALFAATSVFADEPTITPNQDLATPPPSAAVQGTPTGNVSLSSKGQDVREVLHDLFRQGKRNFVLDLKDRTPLYLSLTDVEFEETLAILCQAVGLEYRMQNGIFYIAKAKPRPASRPAANAATGHGPAKPAPVVTALPVTPPAPRGRLPESALNKRVTTRFTKTDFRAVMKDIQRQTGVRLEVDTAVPNRFLDVFLIDTSLKYALDQLTEALGLSYSFSDNLSIRIAKNPPNRVVALGDVPKP